MQELRDVHAEDLKALRATLDSTVEQVTRLTEANNALDDKLARKAEEAAALSARLAGTAEELKVKGETAAKWMAERDSARQAEVAQVRRADEYAQRCEEAQRDAAERAKRCGALEAKLEAVEADIALLEQACLDKKNPIAERNKELSQMVDEYKVREISWKAELDARERDLRAAELEMERVGKSNTFLEDNLQRETRASDARLKEAQRVIDELREKLDLDHTAALELRRQQTEENLKHEGKVGDLSRALAMGQDSLAMTEQMCAAKVETLKKVVDDLREQLARQQQEHVRHIEWLEEGLQKERSGMELRHQRTMDVQEMEHLALKDKHSRDQDAWMKERAELLAQSSLYMKETESVNAAVEGWRRRAEQAEQDVAHANTSLMSLTNKITHNMEVQADPMSLEVSRLTAEVQVTPLMRDIGSFVDLPDPVRDDEAAQLRARVQGIEERYKTTRDSCASLQAELRETTAALQGEQAVNTGLQRQVAALTATADAAEADVRALRARLEEVLAELGKKTQDAERAASDRAAAGAADARAKELEGCVAALQTEGRRLESAVAAKEERLQDVLEDLRAAREEMVAQRERAIAAEAEAKGCREATALLGRNASGVQTPSLHPATPVPALRPPVAFASPYPGSRPPPPRNMHYRPSVMSMHCAEVPVPHHVEVEVVAEHPPHTLPRRHH
eukprot:TRINITY_DN15406_c0_g2_i1.p1 TRINITY_DN15406_c0_g2~~TRINITY_DN15406_c0_g2_i1.p1  ORF type:complete len:720 (+),score=334.06 TRINITY_DN15406_c0_g2_i1:120-2162(+)